MPAVSKKQQKFMGIVHAIQKGEANPSKYSKQAQDAAKKMKKKSAKDYAKTKHTGLPTRKTESGILYKAGVKKYGKEGMKKIQQAAGKRKSHAEIGKIKDKYEKGKKESVREDNIEFSKEEMAILHKDGQIKKDGHVYVYSESDLPITTKKQKVIQVKHKTSGKELIVVDTPKWRKKYKQMGFVVQESVNEVERDYKDEYKKFQSSSKAKKYRAELNKYNRKKGTYGNGDGKDASHSGGKIVGFESQSKNRGRAEKSRMKKEVSVTESDLGLTYKKGKTVKVKHKTSGKQLVIVDKPNVRKEYEKIGFFAEAQVNELVPNMAVINQPAYKQMLDKRVGDVKIKTALANKDHKDHKKAKSIAQRVRDKIKNMMSKKKDDKSKKPKKQSKSDTDFYKRQFTGENIRALKEKMGPEQFHRYMQYVFDTQYK